MGPWQHEVKSSYPALVLILIIESGHKFHRGEAMCISLRLISNDIVYEECVFNGLVIHHLITITCISYEIIFTIYLPKLINIAPL